MNDKQVIEFFIDKQRNKLYESKLNVKYLLTHAIEYKTYLDNRYTDKFDKYGEVIARIYHKIETKPCCKNCGKPLKYKSFKNPYGKWCSTKCQLTDSEFIKWRTEITDYENIKNKSRQTCLERYGDPNYKNLEKAKQTNLERYGVEWYLQSDNENIKRGSKENLEKVKQTCLERYGVEYFFQSNNYKEANKQTCLERYGVESYSATADYKNKVYKTKKKNGTFNSSKIENKLIEYFTNNGINFKTQYKSELYPYMCDFYFPDTQTFVEIQGNWTHGGHPFDENNVDDMDKLKLWESKSTKYYNIAINTWTVSDVEKRKLAQRNNIKLFEIFSIDFDYIISELKLNDTL